MNGMTMNRKTFKPVTVTVDGYPQVVQAKLVHTEDGFKVAEAYILDEISLTEGTVASHAKLFNEVLTQWRDAEYVIQPSMFDEYNHRIVFTGFAPVKSRGRHSTTYKALLLAVAQMQTARQKKAAAK